MNLDRDWDEIPTSSREDLAVRPEWLVPDDADLARMIVYRTAGTTGHALLVPHDARAAACYQPLLEVALERHGVRPAFSSDRVACFLVGAQARTVTYATVLRAWSRAGFAKLNLTSSEWRSEAAPRRFFAELAPQLLTGDPISYAELFRLEIDARPLAMITTAVAMSDAWRARLASRFACPVIDLYSLTETGPIGYGCAGGRGYHVLPHDLLVEVVDPQGRPVPPGTRGEIAVTGGRNPFVPLLRYRTGDWGRLEASSACECGDRAPKILDLEGRAAVLLEASDGRAVNPVDLSGALRAFPLVQHELTQRADRSVQLVVRPVPHAEPLDVGAIREAIALLLGSVPIEVRVDLRLGSRTDGKVLPYKSEHALGN
jgi:phenylacetate-CoA ligase